MIYWGFCVIGVVLKRKVSLFAIALNLANFINLLASCILCMFLSLSWLGYFNPPVESSLTIPSPSVFRPLIEGESILPFNNY